MTDDGAMTRCYSCTSTGATALTDVTSDDLATIYAKPTARVIAKARPEIDIHARKFIEMSPFCVLATSGADGSVDASPRGGGPGFVHVDGPNRLLMPDRPGNNRIDSFKNIVEGTGFVHLVFFVPGIDETLRVAGKGAVTADPALLEAMKEFGKLPRAVLRIDVSEAYFHCGKALMRSKLWSRDTQVERETFPSISEVIHEQTKLGEPETQVEVEARYKTQL
jgi:PPOX class probable FMN-dependent enzyme